MSVNATPRADFFKSEHCFPEDYIFWTVEVVFYRSGPGKAYIHYLWWHVQKTATTTGVGSSGWRLELRFSMTAVTAMTAPGPRQRLFVRFSRRIVIYRMELHSFPKRLAFFKKKNQTQHHPNQDERFLD